MVGLKTKTGERNFNFRLNTLTLPEPARAVGFAAGFTAFCRCIRGQSIELLYTEQERKKEELELYVWGDRESDSTAFLLHQREGEEGGKGLDFHSIAVLFPVQIALRRWLLYFTARCVR